MNVHKVHYETFKKGSRTYFVSSLFFPRKAREAVFKLYGFVRTIDNFVDVIPQKAEEFYQFKERYYRTLQGKPANDVIIDSFVELLKRKQFDPGWVDAFFYSMELDLKKGIYHKLDETLEYVFGSAEVIGLFMAKIMDLPTESYPNARMLGRAMQYINFIRDIDEDFQLGRIYLPLEDTELEKLEYDYLKRHPSQFESFIRHQIQRYRGWQLEAEKGFIYIPKRYLIPIETASDMYKWTARIIEKDPFIVFKKKVKPSKTDIILQITKNFLALKKNRAEIASAKQPVCKGT